MPEPSSLHADAARYIALKQSAFESAASSVPSEVPVEKSERMQEDQAQEEQKAGPIVRQNSEPPQPTSHTLPSAAPAAAAALKDPYASSMPPPPPPFSFGAFGNRSDWPRASMGPSRPPLPPSYPMNHLHAPRPQYDGGARMRGDGFLLDGEDEPESLDLSNSSDADPLPMQLNRAATSGGESVESYLMLIDSERPRSAGPTYAAAGSSSAMTRTSTGDSAASSIVLVCPNCGEQPSGVDTESSFHAHVSRCFVSAVAQSPGRRSVGPQSNGESGGPIRKTRSRAASAAAATGNAAELASALAQNVQSPTTPDAHYHPYGAGSLTSTLRQLRRTVDQLDLHQRISIMEAFHRLSRAAMAEQAQAQALTPRGKSKLRSATNSPSPKHKPLDDKVCSNILSLLYSPRLTAPHPSPAAFGGLAVGVPSPLRIGVSHHEAAAASNTPMDTADSGLRSIVSSPVAGMDTLELGAALQTPMRGKYLFALASSPDPVASPMDLLGSPSSIMPDGSESEATGSLAMTSSFVRSALLSTASGASSPASSSALSEQTSPSAPTEHSAYSVDRASRLERFPTHCYPDTNGARSEVRSPDHSNQAAACNAAHQQEDAQRRPQTVQA